jgi:isopenicillin N synthase-like dioxygenase
MHRCGHEEDAMTITDYRAAALEGQVVPIIDISGWSSGDADARRRVAAEVDAACCEIGFFLVTGHDVDPGLTARMYDVTKRFFALPDGVKARWSSPTGNTYRGWAVRGAPGPTTGVRLRESYEVCRYDSVEELAAVGYGQRWLDGFDPNIWPDDPPDFRAVWSEYYVAVRDLGARLLSICAGALGLDDSWFVDKFDRETSYLSGNLYPAEHQPTGDGLRFGAHTDIGSLTILYQDGGPGGLQVLDRLGRWCDVAEVPGSYVVNLGDMLAKWTNDRWVATMHRVVRPRPSDRREDRVSLPYFQHPNFDALIECIATCTGPDNPAKYPPVLGGDWATYRFNTADYG